VSTSTEHRCVVHGLEVASDLELPELRVDGALVRPRGTQGPDVEIRLGEIPAHPSDPSDRWFHVRPDGTVVVRVEGVAGFAVREGRRIDVEPAPDADAAEVRTYLLGSGIGLLLHQRGELPLHVSAVVLDGRAWAFTAPAATADGLLGPLVRAAGGQWALGLVRAPALLAGVLVAVLAIILPKREPLRRTLLIVATAGVVGNLPDVPAMDIHYGRAAVFTPSDFEFARDGIQAEADANVETMLVTDLDISDLYRSRLNGSVTPVTDRRTDLFEFHNKLSTEMIAPGVQEGHL
jgi:hypothetical protein